MASGRFPEFDGKEVEQTLPERFRKMVEKHPGRTAVKAGGRTLTYEGLDRAAGALAAAIAEAGPVHRPVACLQEPGIEQITAILAALKAGRIYLSLDPSFPEARLRYMLEDSRAGLVVADENSLALAGELSGKRIPLINTDRADPSGPKDFPVPEMSPDSIANIFYTSGSTGEPKGVMQNHRNVLHNVMDVTNSYRLTQDDRLALLISTGFAASQTPIFASLMNGAALCPLSLKGDGLLRLADWLTEERISFYLSVTTTFRRFAETLSGGGKFPHLRHIVLGGETVTVRDVQLYREFFPESCTLHVRLASTETFRLCSFPIDRRTVIEGGDVPVGYPVADKEILLMDETGREAARGEPGEIVVKSRYLSPGYWGRPDLTEEDFRPDPERKDRRVFRTGSRGRFRFDGCLDLLGRMDFQVKIRGHRVEPGEVEKALLDLPGIREAAVVPLEDPHGSLRLAAYLVPRDEPGPATDTLRRGLEENLPEYMIPSHFVKLGELPLAPTGKVDRSRLPHPGRARPDLQTAYAPPRSETEEKLAEIWSDLLGISPVGVSDRFCDLGADSFDYVRLAVEVEGALGRSFPLENFLGRPTVEHLAGLLELPGEGGPAPRGGEDGPAGPDNHWTPVTYRGLDFNPPAIRALKMIIFSLIKASGRIIPYSSWNRLNYWLRGRRWVQSLFFRKRRMHVRVLLALAGREADEDEIVARSSSISLLSDLNKAVLARMPEKRFRKWSRVSGLPGFLEAHRRGKGVILLNSHFGAAHMDLLVLHRSGIDDVVTLGGWPTEIQLLNIPEWRQVKFKIEYRPEEQSLFGPMVLAEAKPVLDGGGIIRIAPDGRQGTGGFILPFFSRKRIFRAGFAELALATGAAVIPVFGNIEPDGRLNLEFLDPLDQGDETMDRGERIEGLVAQYARLLEGKWAEHPEAVSEKSLWIYIEWLQMQDAGNAGANDPKAEISSILSA